MSIYHSHTHSINETTNVAAVLTPYPQPEPPQRADVLMVAAYCRSSAVKV